MASDGKDVIANIRVVLVEPLYAGNVGATCRAMLNMGLKDLVLVAPRIENWDEGRAMAVHARGVLEQRREVATLEEATADCVAVMGTTARAGLYRQHVKSVREWSGELLRQAAVGPVALVFGRENHGLSNDEVSLCTHLARIPTACEYSSLNLSQAVMVCCYELFQAGGSCEMPAEKTGLAPACQKKRLHNLWREAMLQIGFMREQKADHMMQGFQRIFSRGVKTDDDVSIMMGVARQAMWAAERKND